MKLILTWEHFTQTYASCTHLKRLFAFLFSEYDYFVGVFSHGSQYSIDLTVVNPK